MSNTCGKWETERPKTERKLNRIKDLYWFIKKNGPVKTKFLVEEFGMSYRTVQRDLDVLLYNGLIQSPKVGIWMVTKKKVKGESND